MIISEFIFKAINGLANNIEMLDNIMIILSKAIPYFLIAATSITYIYGWVNKDAQMRSIAFHAVIKTAIAYLISQIIGYIFYTPRPFVKEESCNLLYKHKANASFPSDHALGSMGLALGLNKLGGYLGKIYITLAIVVGIARVYVGHHYPLDVLGGFVLAAVIGKLYDNIVGKKINLKY